MPDERWRPVGAGSFPQVVSVLGGHFYKEDMKKTNQSWGLGSYFIGLRLFYSVPPFFFSMLTIAGCPHSSARFSGVRPSLSFALIVA